MKDTLYQRLIAIEKQYNQLGIYLADTEVMQDLEKFKELSKEYAKLKPIYEHFQQYRLMQRALIDNEELLEDADEAFRTLAKAEKAALSEKTEQLAHQLQIMLLPEDPDDKRNVFLEIRAAAGGAESSLFADNLLNMYLRYAESQQWGTEIISSHPSEQGGYKEVIVKLTGASAYSHLKFESGAHRVQRVPETEAQGRVHTSTCTVVILPEADTIDAIQLNPSELRIDTFRASGAGGQHVQKTDSAVRIVHIPTGVKVECQDERSQHKNRERALSLLTARILSSKREKQRQAAAATRKNLVGTGDRSERIRTYNVPQGRVTDHRIPLTLYQLNAVLQGNLSLILDPLKQHYQLDQLKEAYS